MSCNFNLRPITRKVDSVEMSAWFDEEKGNCGQPMVVCKAEVAAIFADQAGLAKTVDSLRYSVRLCLLQVIV